MGFSTLDKSNPGFSVNNPGYSISVKSRFWNLSIGLRAYILLLLLLGMLVKTVEVEGVVVVEVYV